MTALRACFSAVTNKEITYQVGKAEYRIKYSYAEHKIEGQIENSKLCYLTFESNQRTDIAAKQLDAAYYILATKINKCSTKFDIITLYDERSIYFSTRAYPLFCEFETKLRCLILKLLTKSYGVLWADRTLPDEIKVKVKENLRGADIHKLASEAIFAMDFSALNDFLFQGYRTVKSDEIIDTYLSREKLAQYDPEKICEILEMARAKSNWERYFAEKFPTINLEEDLSIIRISRNNIAHNKKYTGNEYKDDKKRISGFCKMFDAAIDYIEVKPITIENGWDTILGLSLIENNSMLHVSSKIGEWSKIALKAIEPIISAGSITLSKSKELTNLALKYRSFSNIISDKMLSIDLSSISASAKLMDEVLQPLKTTIPKLLEINCLDNLPNTYQLKGLELDINPRMHEIIRGIQESIEILRPSNEALKKIMQATNLVKFNSSEYVKQLTGVNQQESESEIEENDNNSGKMI